MPATEPTRFENGVTDALTGMWSKAGFPSKRKWHFYDQDWDHYVAGDWTSTETEAGAGDTVIALTDGEGGVLLVTNDAADNDATFLQKKGESFKFAAGKRTFFESRIKTSDATQSDIVIGLQITDTTPLAVTDGVYFLKADDAATVEFKSLMNSAGVTQAAVATMADNTWITLGFYYDGASAIEVYVNDVLVATVTVSAGTTLCNDEELTVSFGIQNGAAAAKTLSVDYIFVAQER